MGACSTRDGLSPYTGKHFTAARRCTRDQTPGVAVDAAAA